MATGPLHDTEIARSHAQILEYVQYDAVTVTLGGRQFRNLSQALRELAERSQSIDRADVRALLEAEVDSLETTKHQVVLTTQQYADLVEYIAQGDYCRTADSAPDGATAVLAFSYGEAPDVNVAIASKIWHIFGPNPRAPIYAQWEIADPLCGLIGPAARNLRQRPRPAAQTGIGGSVVGDEPGLNVHRIALDRGSDYITTRQVVGKFKNMYEGDCATAKVFLACQAWHAPRCEQICREGNLNVIGGAFVDQFSPGDPQPWVRDVLSHLVKESRKVRRARSE